MKMTEDEIHKVLEYTAKKKKVKISVSEYGLRCWQLKKKRNAEIFYTGPGQVVRCDLFTKNIKEKDFKIAAVVMQSSVPQHPYEMHIVGLPSVFAASEFRDTARSMVRTINLMPAPAPPAKEGKPQMDDRGEDDNDFETEA